MKNRIPFGTSRRPLDPKICNIALDANALDCDGSERDRLIERFRELVSAGTLIVALGGGVRVERMVLLEKSSHMELDRAWRRTSGRIGTYDAVCLEHG